MKTIAQIAAELQGYDPQALSAADVNQFLDRLVEPVTATEVLPLFSALGRVLAQDVISPVSVPPHDNSAMDGFAFDGAQLNSGQPLATALVTSHGASVLARVVARMIEVARVLPQMETWLSEIRPGDPFCVEWRTPESARGVGLVEAARGALGHWLTIERGRIAGYQIIAPTTWNFSPRDATGQPGALEQALVGLPVGEGETAPMLVQHVVRSFDPCMVCTVH